MATYDTIKAEVQKRIGNRQDADINSRLGTWINDAYFELLLEPEYTFYELDREYTLNTVADQRDYDISVIDDLWFILMIRDMDNEREIRKTSIKVMDRLSNSSGQPNRYARFAKTLELDPTPDDTYELRIRYRYRPNELITGTSPLTGREWDEIIVVKSTIKAYEALEQPEKAAAARNLEIALLDHRKDLEILEDEDSDIGIKVRMKGRY